MKILIVSAACGNKKRCDVFSKSKKNMIVSSQRYFYLLAKGLSEIDGVDVTCITAIPVSHKTTNIKRFKEDKEVDSNISFIYIPFKNGIFSRFISTYVNVSKYVRRWINDNKKEECYLITDTTIWIASIPARRVSAGRIKTIACVTDLPVLLKKRTKNPIRSFVSTIICKWSSSSINKYDSYVLLTEEMKNRIRIKKKPYIVCECMVDENQSYEPPTMHSKKTFVYAGGVYKKYGIDRLINAFERSNIDGKLLICGNGDYEDVLKERSNILKKTEYLGCLPFEKTFELEKSADILVNPRPTSDEYTLFSFPSKTAEYLTAGRAVLSTRLGGIPSDYFPYIMWFDGDNEESFVQKFNEISNISVEELNLIGKKGYVFCVKNKSYVNQAKRIITFLKNEMPTFSS